MNLQVPSSIMWQCQRGRHNLVRHDLLADLRCAAAWRCRHHALSQAGGKGNRAGEAEGADKCQFSGDIFHLQHSKHARRHEHSLWFVGDSQRSGGSLDDWWTLLQVMNALAMDFEDDTFDLVWACESGEHMPDKKKYVEEMARVLKPGTSSTP